NILTAIAGSRKPGQVKELAASAGLRPSQEALDRLTAASDVFHKIKPRFRPA
ncbi:MAG: hypothetical protein HY580_06515, partial [Nitrospinae bacterium]|nr:hypothetical protein [Nitrospinota bacterium]